MKKFSQHGGRPRDPSAEERIRQAAGELFLEHGIDGTTVDAVAERAGVGKATVYRRWASKEDLVLAAFDCLVEGEMPPIDTGSLVGDLTEIYKNLLEFAHSSDGQAFFRLMAAESARDPKIAEIYRCGLMRRFEGCAPVFLAARERGELDLAADCQMIFEWPIGVILTRILMGSELPQLADASRMAAATANGLAKLPVDGLAANHPTDHNRSPAHLT